MNRFSDGIWMQSSGNHGGNDRYSSFESGRDNDGGMWNSRNDLRSEYQNDLFSRDTMRGSNGQGNNSFLSYLEQRNSQNEQIIDSPVLNNNGNQRFYNERERNWNAIDFTSDAIGLRSNIDDGIGNRNLPLLTPPNNGMRQPGSLFDGPRDDGRSWSNSRMDYNMPMRNESSSRRSFGDSNEPVRVTILRKDVGSKIIGKHGMLIKDLEAKSHAVAKVADKPGTDKAIVEIFGSSEEKNIAVQIIMKKCGSSLEVDWPDRSKGTNGGSGNSRPSPFIVGSNYSGQGLLKSPPFSTPNTDMPYWKSQPKPLMSQKMNNIIGKKNSFQNKSKGAQNQGQRFFNAKKNGKKPNPVPSNRNQVAGVKRPKNKSPKPNNNNSNTDSNAQKGPSAKKAKRDLYSDADLAPEPKSLEGGEATGFIPCLSWQDELKDLAQSLVKVRDDFLAPSLGPNHEQIWDKKSKNAVEHFGAGSFETGIELLRKQYGIVNFEPFKQLAMSAFTGSKLRITATPELPTLIFSTRIKAKEGENATVQPTNSATSQQPNQATSIFQLGDLLKRLQQGYSFTTSGKFSEAIAVFRDILYAIPFLIAADKAEMAKIRKLGIICREYITGLTLEITRLQLPKVTIDDQKRICELAAYFTRCNLQSSHRMLTLSTSLNLFFKLKNFKTAASFAKRLLELEPSADMIPQLTKIVEVCNTNLVDEHELNYEDCKTFIFCSQTLKRIKLGDQDLKCPFCYVRCAMECKGQICKVCTVAEIGKDVHSEAK